MSQKQRVSVLLALLAAPLFRVPACEGSSSHPAPGSLADICSKAGASPPPTPPTTTKHHFSGQHQSDLSWRLDRLSEVRCGRTAASDATVEALKSMEGGRKTEPDGSKRESGRATEHEAQRSLSLSLHTNSQTPKKEELQQKIEICNISKTRVMLSNMRLHRIWTVFT